MSTLNNNQPSEKELRIARRLQAAKERLKENDASTANETQNQEAEKPMSISKRQIQQSRRIVDESHERASTVVSEIQVERVQAEAERRMREKQKSEERMRLLHNELIESAKLNREIEAKWDVIAQKTVAQELFHEMGKQYQESAALLRSKDSIIETLQKAIKEKDEEYVQELAKHQEDMVELVSRMQQQYRAHLESCEEQLRRIEAKFEEERGQLMDQMKSLLNERRAIAETKFMNDFREREERYYDELAKIRQRDAEDYNALNTWLESNVELLEQQLEEMRATYQLNAEKLDYNHAVLCDREKENTDKLAMNSLKLNQLRSALATAVNRFKREDANYKRENEQLTKEFHKVADQFKELQLKYKRFEAAGRAKYQEIWALNEEQVMNLVRRVLLADKLIHEQILCTDWECTIKPPSGLKVTDPMTLTALDTVNSTSFGDRGPLRELTRSILSGNDGTEGESKGDDKRSGSAAGEARAPETHEPAPSAGRDVGGRIPAHSPATIRKVLDQIAAEATFLIDARSMEHIRSLPPEEQQLYTVDVILAALGVHDKEDLDELVSAFDGNELEDGSLVSAASAAAASALNVGESSGIPMSAGTKHPNDVVRTLKAFVESRLGSQAALGDSASNERATTSSLTPAVNPEAVERRLRKRSKEQLFWKRLGDPLGSGRLRVWQALAQGLRKYTALLEERAKVIEDTTALARQNEELKILLQEYLGSKINQELQVPPTRLIKVDANAQTLPSRRK